LINVCLRVYKVFNVKLIHIQIKTFLITEQRTVNVTSEIEALKAMKAKLLKATALVKTKIVELEKGI